MKPESVDENEIKECINDNNMEVITFLDTFQ